MLKKHQPPFSVEQQLFNLEDLGLIIENREEAKKFLNDVSYFRLIKAYGFGLKEKNHKYHTGVSFDQIKGLYIFNAKLRHLLFAELEKVEVNLRCRLANYLSCKYGVFGYKDSSNFKDEARHKKFLADLEVEIERNKKSAFVKNFRENYEGGDLPFYAVVELCSFGMLSKFFKNMKNEDKKAIGKQYGIAFPYLESWFEHLSYVRNACAHYGRLYNNSSTITPILFKQYTSRKISSLRLYATLVCLKHLLPNDSHWNKFLVSIQLLLEQYSCVNTDLMGFPKENWILYLSLPVSEFEKHGI